MSHLKPLNLLEASWILCIQQLWEKSWVEPVDNILMKWNMPDASNNYEAWLQHFDEEQEIG